TPTPTSGVAAAASTPPSTTGALPLWAASRAAPSCPTKRVNPRPGPCAGAGEGERRFDHGRRQPVSHRPGGGGPGGPAQPQPVQPGAEAPVAGGAGGAHLSGREAGLGAGAGAGVAELAGD